MTVEGSPARWVVVTRPDRPGLLDELAWRYRHTPWVEVLPDRRRGERRRQREPRGVDLRLGERRGVPGDSIRPRAYRLVRAAEGYNVYEATVHAAARCPECGATATLGMPCSGDPPAQLGVRVVDDLIPLECQHRAPHRSEAIG